MKRAIAVLVLVAVAALVVVIVNVSSGPATGPTRPKPETQRNAPGKVDGTGSGFAPGDADQASPADD